MLCLGQVRCHSKGNVYKFADSSEILACMNDQSDIPREYERIPRELLKHGKGRQSHIILVPQPSDSPNDPLNVRLHMRGCPVGRDAFID